MNNMRKARKRAKLTQAQVASKIGLSQNQYSNWETGKSAADPEALLKLAQIFEVTVSYLVGEDEVIKLRQSPTACRIPVVGTVAAGIPIDAIEDIVDWEEIPNAMAKTGEFFGLRVKGNSMEPRISGGDTVIVRRQHDVESGEIAIIIVNGDEGTCKKVLKHANGSITLVSLNPAFEPRYLTPQEIEELPVTIVGKVVELRGKF